MSTSARSLFGCLSVVVAVAFGHACSDDVSGPAGGDTGGASGRTTGSGPSTGAGGSGYTGTTGGSTTGVGTTTTGSGSGTGGSTTTTTSTGVGGSSTGAGGTGGSGGAGGQGGASGSSGTGGSGGSTQACGWSGTYTGPLLGKCATTCTDGNCGTSVGKGGFLTLDDFEGVMPGTVTGTGTIGITWPSRDGRNGSWHQYSDATANASMTIAATSGGSPNSTQAIHYGGGKGPWGATLSLPLGGAQASGQAGCYDASAYDGISFWIKGDTSGGKNTQMKLNVQTPVSEPTDSGGACTGNCRDHFAKIVDIPGNWNRVKVAWSDLKRLACSSTTPPTPSNFNPQKQILAISFQQLDPSKAFDFWIDDITFDIDSRPSNNFGDIVTQPIYNEMFKGAVAPYAYQGFVAAVAKYGSALAGTGTALDKKHEAAAFLAHIAHETGSLTTAKEKCSETCPTQPTACTPTEASRACTMSPYYGRGALQLTGLSNYTSAQNAGFSGIVTTPDRVIQSADFAFGTAVWFWMNSQSGVGVCHTAIMGQNFGQTTRIINGIECGGTLQNSRVKLYREFCGAIGINVRGTLTCS